MFQIQTKWNVVSKNEMVIEKGNIYVKASNVQANNLIGYFTASFSDYQKIAPHRWRIYDTSIVTPMKLSTYSYEKPVDAATFLSNKNPDERLTYLDGNPLNVRSDNLVGEHRMGSPSTITKHGKVSTLHLNMGVNVRFDSKFIELVDRYTWFASLQKLPGRTNTMIRASANEGRIFLHRLLLDILEQDARSSKVMHCNGDQLDCRLTNLRIYSGKKPT